MGEEEKKKKKNEAGSWKNEGKERREKMKCSGRQMNVTRIESMRKAEALWLLMEQQQ